MPLPLEVELEFSHHVSNHVMGILKDDEVYRHLLFKDSKSDLHTFEIISWPNHLTINSTLGTYTVQEFDVNDVLEMLSKKTKPFYWGACRHTRFKDNFCLSLSHKKCEEICKSYLDAWFEDVDEMNRQQYPDLYLNIWSELGPIRNAETREKFVSEASKFNYEGFSFPKDIMEEDIMNYTHEFLWHCNAIYFGAKFYFKNIRTKESKTKMPSAKV